MQEKIFSISSASCSVNKIYVDSIFKRIDPLGRLNEKTAIKLAFSHKTQGANTTRENLDRCCGV